VRDRASAPRRSTRRCDLTPRGFDARSRPR